MDARPTVTLLTGFLGSGKTTLLNAILRRADHRYGVIVNDFGAINIDAMLTAGVESVEGEVALSNGCVCCSIRGDLLDALLDLARRTPPPTPQRSTLGSSEARRAPECATALNPCPCSGGAR